jgi:hypothetical protein
LHDEQYDGDDQVSEEYQHRDRCEAPHIRETCVISARILIKEAGALPVEAIGRPHLYDKPPMRQFPSLYVCIPLMVTGRKEKRAIANT